MLKSLALNQVGPAPKLAAHFGERLNLLTGDSALGKSFLLDTAFWALTGTWPGGRTALPDGNRTKKDAPSITYHVVGKTSSDKGPKTAAYDFHSQTWTRPRGRPRIPGLVIYAAVDGSFAVWDPARNYRRDPKTGVKEAEEEPRAYQFTPQSLTDGLEEEGRVLCKGLVEDWVNWFYEQFFDRNGGHDDGPFAHLAKVISSLSPPQEPMRCAEPRRVYVDQPRKYPVLTMPYGDVAYPQWSAAVRRIVSLAYLLVWSWYEHCQAAKLRRETTTDRIVLIVDEIEAHLHPKWQRTILPALLDVVRTFKDRMAVQLLTATHSPLILASVEPRFAEEQDRLFWFELNEKNRISLRDYPWAIHGDVDGWLTSPIFGLKEARSREAEDVLGAAESYMAGDISVQPEDLRTREAIQKEMRRVLPGDDPIWARWLIKTRGGVPQ